MSADVVIGVDIGTTSTKAVAFTADATARASARAEYPTNTAEQDAAAVADAAITATRDAIAAARDAGHRVAALSFSAAMHSLVGLDRSGRPVTPLVTWADTRASAQAAALRADPLGPQLHRRTGTPVHPMSPLVKLRWFADEARETAPAHWAGIKELVLLRLTGELVSDHGIASGTGLFDLQREEWDEEALDYARVTREQLPRLVPTMERLQLAHDGARALGAEAPLVIGGADGPLANLGLGAIRAGTVACSIGTSGALRAAVETPAIDDRGRVFCYVLAPGRYVVGGAVNNGGVVLDWLRDAVAPDLDVEAILEAAATAPAGSAGLLFLPQLLGERAPSWSGRPRGAYVGLTREHRREHLLRAGLEGVCLQLAAVLAALAGAGIEVREIRATGGFSRSPLWRAILAAALRHPIGFAASPEGSSLGAALLGMSAIGMLDSIDRAAELVAVSEVERPEPADAELYERMYSAFEAAYDALARL